MLVYENHEDLKDVNVKDFYVRAKDRTEHLKKLDVRGTFFTEFELRCKDEHIIWGRDYPRAVIDSGGKIKYYDGILVDITKQKMAEEELKEALNKLESLSLRDDLTGLYNRRGFFTIEAFNKSKENPFPLSVSMGVAHYDPGHPCTIDELLVRADKIMYEVKRHKGRA